MKNEKNYESWGRIGPCKSLSSLAEENYKKRNTTLLHTQAPNTLVSSDPNTFVRHCLRTIKKFKWIKYVTFDRGNLKVYEKMRRTLSPFHPHHSLLLLLLPPGRRWRRQRRLWCRRELNCSHLKYAKVKLLVKIISWKKWVYMVSGVIRPSHPAAL